METNPTETIYGKSLGLNIPRLTCDNLGAADCNTRNVFIRSQDNVHNANVYLIYMINCFVDFFIQYQTIEDEPLEFGLQTLLDLKKVIFSFCLINTETNYFESFFSRFQEKFNACIIMINNRFKITKNIGDPTASSMETLEGTQESFLWLKRKAANLFILGLSYKFLSMSRSLGIHIKDMTADTDNIINTEKKREQSFILQFLPENRELQCFKKVDFFFFQHMNSVVFEKILVLAEQRAAEQRAAEQRAAEQAKEDTGGSKRVNNKSRKNKYKRKCNHKYKKSRKNKRHRRKRTQSNQNKMF